MNQLVDKAALEEVVTQIKAITHQTEKVLGIYDLKTRVSDNKIYVDKQINIEEGHQIATKVHDLLEKNIRQIKHCMVHVEPF